MVSHPCLTSPHETTRWETEQATITEGWLAAVPCRVLNMSPRHGRLTCVGPTVRHVCKSYPSPCFTCSTSSFHVWLYTVVSSINATLHSPNFVSTVFPFILNVASVFLLLPGSPWDIQESWVARVPCSVTSRPFDYQGLFFHAMVA